MIRSLYHPLSYVIPTLILLGLLALSGCGSSKDESVSADPDANIPVLTLTPNAIKTFHFAWSDIQGETEYRLLEDPDGQSGFTQVASVAANTTSYALEASLPGRINARYILQACTGENCVDSAPVYVVGSLVEAIGYLKASNTDAGDEFGQSVALSGDGNTLAVGAVDEDSKATGINGEQIDNSVDRAGAVYVFIKSDNTWSQQAYIKASNTDGGDYFGFSLHLSGDGDTLAVGAPGESSNATGVNGDQSDNGAQQSGAAYVFTRSGDNWSQQAYIKASNTEVFDLFGSSLSLSGDGNVLAVGAVGEGSKATGINGDQNDNGAEQSGAAYVFTRSGDSWSQQAYIKASTADLGAGFGCSVALSGDGNTLAVGAWGERSSATGINGDQSDNGAQQSGAAYVFTRNGDSWSQQAYIKASNTDMLDLFGSSLSLSGDGSLLAVGAPGESSATTGINGDQSDNWMYGAGAVYVFTRVGERWSQQAYIKASDTDVDDQFGHSVALSSDASTLAVGAYLKRSNAAGVNGTQSDRSVFNSISGAAYVFTRSSDDWSPQAYINASNSGGGDRFGGSLSLSGDGKALAVGAYGEAGNATGVNGDQNDNIAARSGAVYLY